MKYKIVVFTRQATAGDGWVGGYYIYANDLLVHSNYDKYTLYDYDFDAWDSKVTQANAWISEAKRTRLTVREIEV